MKYRGHAPSGVLIHVPREVCIVLQRVRARVMFSLRARLEMEPMRLTGGA